jgi:thymidylate synthase (FAD)
MLKYAQVELLHVTQDADKLIELSGRTCYQSQDKITTDSTKKFVEKIVNNKHHSVLEHATATFKISNVSRALTHQLVRHRLCSFSQQSQRYVPENQFDYIIPPDIYKCESSREQFIASMTLLSKHYEELRKQGINKEDCRFLLPNACCTEIVITANFRQWRHILEERLSKGAQWEIKAMAILLHTSLMRQSIIFKTPELIQLNCQAHNQIENISYDCREEPYFAYFKVPEVI